MATLNEAIARWRSVNVAEMAAASVRENKDAILDIQREQLRLGKNREGQKIGWYRSLRYAQFKRDRGAIAPFRVPDLLLTGRFYGGLTLNVQGSKLVITSTDEKTPRLVERFGEEIFGLDDQSCEALREEVFTPDMCRRIRNHVDL